LDINKIKTEIEGLIAKYKKAKNENLLNSYSEANVRKDFIDVLFQTLGWDIHDKNEYSSEMYIRKKGFVDITFLIEEKPKIFLEAKKFSIIQKVEDRNKTFNESTDSSLQGDWTSEERQVLNYALGEAGLTWAIITNFEIFRLFNTKNGLMVLNFDDPSEYLERFDELILFHKKNVKSGLLNKIETREERGFIDIKFITLLKDWTERLANDIYEKNQGTMIKINDSTEILIDFERNPKSKKIVLEGTQRIIDKLLIIRRAEDRFVVNPDMLESIMNTWKNTQPYSSLYSLLFDVVGKTGFFYKFNELHNSKIFEIEHFSNFLKISDDVIAYIIKTSYHQSFRKFSGDILGATYEAFLSFELKFENSTFEVVIDTNILKEEGIYYTPVYIVDFIIKRTIKKKLATILDVLSKDITKLKEEDMINDIKKITIGDISCGSGNFLLKAYTLIISFYSKILIELNKYEQKKTTKIMKKYPKRGMQYFQEITDLNTEMIELSKIMSLKNSEILTRHIFGVDLDPNAAEISTVNLIFMTLEKNEILPFILGGNIKVGNSLVYRKLLRKNDSLILKLIEKRKKIKKEGEVEKRKQLVNEEINIKKELMEELEPINYEIQNDPFNFQWIFEFPEILYQLQGFGFIVGNPPYIQLSMDSNLRELYQDYLKDFYGSSMGRLNTFGFFIKLGIDLLTKDGMLGYIVPNTILNLPYYKELREMILNSCNIESICLLQYLPFKNALVENVIIILKKEEDENIRRNNIVEIIDMNKVINHENANLKIRRGKCPSVLETDKWEVKQEKFMDDSLKRFSVFLTEDLETLKDKMDGDYPQIKENFDVVQAIAIKGDKNSYIYKKQKIQGKKGVFNLVLEGIDVNKYEINYVDKYLDYKIDSIHSCKRQDIFLIKEKIYFRRTGKGIVATIDKRRTFALNTLVTITLKDVNDIGENGLYFLLGILNSEIINNYFRLFLKSTKVLFSEIQARQLERIPIPINNKILIKEIADNVKKILILKEVFNELLKKFKEMLDTYRYNVIKNLKDIFSETNHKGVKFLSIDPIKSRLIEHDAYIISEYSVIRKTNSIIISPSEKNSLDFDQIVEIHFNDQDYIDFFFLNLLMNSLEKSYRTKKNIIETVLIDFEFRLPIKNWESSAKKIKQFMKIFDEYFNENIVKKLVKENLSDISDLKTLVSTYEESINYNENKIQNLYDLTDIEVEKLSDLSNSIL